MLRLDVSEPGGTFRLLIQVFDRFAEAVSDETIDCSWKSDSKNWGWKSLDVG